MRRKLAIFYSSSHTSSLSCRRWKMTARVRGSPEVADVRAGFRPCQAAIARRFHSSTSAGRRRRVGPDRSCTTPLRTGRIAPPVISPYVERMQPFLQAIYQYREDYLLSTPTVQSNKTRRRSSKRWSLKSYCCTSWYFGWFKGNKHVNRGVVQWDLIRKPNRILKDTNEAKRSECGNLPLSDPRATGLLLNPHRQPAQHSKIGVPLCSCPWEA